MFQLSKLPITFAFIVLPNTPASLPLTPEKQNDAAWISFPNSFSTQLNSYVPILPKKKTTEEQVGLELKTSLKHFEGWKQSQNQGMGSEASHVRAEAQF